MDIEGNAATLAAATGGILSRERIIAQPGFKPWLVPPATLAIHLCIGMAYGFSVFWLPLSQAVGIADRRKSAGLFSRRDDFLGKGSGYAHRPDGEELRMGNPATASELRRLAQDTEGKLSVFAMDVTDAKGIRNAATQLKDVAIDVLINSAGIAGAGRPAMSTTIPGSCPRCEHDGSSPGARVLQRVARSERRLVVTITSGLGSYRPAASLPIAAPKRP